MPRPCWQKSRAEKAGPQRCYRDRDSARPLLITHAGDKCACIFLGHFTFYPVPIEPLNGFLGYPLRRGSRSDGADLGNGRAMARDHHVFALFGALDEFGKIVLGFGDGMMAHTEIIAIGWLFCPPTPPSPISRDCAAGRHRCPWPRPCDMRAAGSAARREAAR